MDLIEILWKQDVDLGYSLDISPTKSHKQNGNNADTKRTGSSSTPTSSTEDDDVEKLKTLEALNDNFFKVSIGKNKTKPNLKRLNKLKNCY